MLLAFVVLGFMGELYKNGWTDRDAVLACCDDSCGSKGPCVRWGSISAFPL